jgi:DNA repair protein RadC
MIKPPTPITTASAPQSVITLKHRPADEQPREKLLQYSAQALSDGELLAIFLRTGIRGKTAVDLARDLLSEYGSLRALFNASRSRLCQTKGMGDAKYTQLQAVLEMARRCLWEDLQRGDGLTSPQQSRDYLQAQLSQEPREVFAALFLDSQHRVLSFEKLFYGTINNAAVHPREVVRRCLELGAAALIVAHNHPSGIAEPSQADRQITEQLQRALALIDVRLLDHIVIGQGLCSSFAERGWL